MKQIFAIALAAALAASSASAISPKRGVSENQFSLGSQMEILAPGVGWYYNWGNTPGRGYQDEVINFADMEFVPMAWNASYNANSIREYCKAHPECKYILGFNEPNFTAQSNMTPAVAAQHWPALRALADELGLAIVAPALNYSPNAPYQSPTKWMDEFVALVGLDAFDYVAIHNYGGLGVMKTLAGEFHSKYGKPVWVTEFCYWPNEGQANSRVEPAVQIASMVETVEWLEKTDYIYRYAWFKAVGKHENTATSSSPCYGLIVTENGLGPRKLSPQGYVYTYMSDFDPDRWHSAGTVVPATEYIDRYNASLAPGANPDAPLPIEISQFNAGATLDYQFDVPADGFYNLTLTVTGQGEPVRFDPSIAIYDVNGDATVELCPVTTFTLPGNEIEYVDRRFEIKLTAGHHTIRIADGSPYRPSGIRICSLRLDDRDGIEDVIVDPAVDPDAPVYTLDGRQVTGALAPGIYVTRGHKILVK